MVPDSPLPMTHLGRYALVRRLGRGGMAEVFEARHVDLGTRVAIKVINPGVGANEGGIDRVLREGRAAAAIHHPHVVTVVDVGADDRTPYLVMELLEGEDLASHLARDAPLPVEKVVQFLLPVLSGVCAAHRAGIIHRDLKPSNIFLAARHRGIEPVVVDFGISKVMLPSSPAAPSSRVMVGTVQYMAPEQVRGSARASPKSDQYALGVILYECATGGAPFWDEDHYELLHSIMTASLVPPSEINPRIPTSFDAVVLRALARDPAARFPSVEALGGALLRFADEETRQRWSEEFAPHAEAETERAALSTRRALWARRPAIVVLFGLVTLLASVTAIGGALTARPASVPRTTSENAPADALQTAALVAPASSVSGPVAIEIETARPSPSPAVPSAPEAPPPRAAVARAPTRLPAPRPPPSASEGRAPAVERGTANIPIVE